MNLKLDIQVIELFYPSAIEPEKKHSKRFCISVVDTEKAKTYPANFMCILPQYLTEKCKFYEVFGNDIDLMFRLLNEALENPEYSNKPYIVAEINRRIRLFPSIKKTAKCIDCGKDFEFKPTKRIKKRFLCYECKGKRILEQAKKQQINPNLPTSFCLFCNKEFSLTRSTKKYCSVSCYNKAKWIRRKQNTDFSPNKPKIKRVWLPKNVRDAYA